MKTLAYNENEKKDGEKNSYQHKMKKKEKSRKKSEVDPFVLSWRKKNVFSHYLFAITGFQLGFFQLSS